MTLSSDRAFFSAEIERLAGRLYGTALRLTHNPADAEDLVAETVTKAWAALPKLADRNCFEKWAFRILANTYISNRRRPCEVTAATAAEEDAQGQFSLFDRLHQPFLLWWGNPEQELLNKLLREDIERALAALPDDYRTVVVLVEMQGQSYAEAAEILSVPLGTVRSRLSRARSLLQRALWEHARAAGLLPHAHRREHVRD
ncbi:MAG: sigma-70 family RNA polymerase sigma factor [Hyphomicrobiaceae bacterium]|nr:MAG: sigma-70 family RNA polymerase sigma factor [Hyphomicrobiaceae bacterium]